MSGRGANTDHLVDVEKRNKSKEREKRKRLCKWTNERTNTWKNRCCTLVDLGVMPPWRGTWSDACTQPRSGKGPRNEVGVYFFGSIHPGVFLSFVLILRMRNYSALSLTLHSSHSLYLCMRNKQRAKRARNTRISVPAHPNQSNLATSAVLSRFCPRVQPSNKNT